MAIATRTLEEISRGTFEGPGSHVVTAYLIVEGVRTRVIETGTPDVIVGGKVESRRYHYEVSVWISTGWAHVVDFLDVEVEDSRHAAAVAYRILHEEP